MVNYTLQTNGLSNTSIHIFPAIANSSLASAVGAYDMQFSLNGSSWKPVSNTAYYYTFNEMKAQTRSMFSSRATSLTDGEPRDQRYQHQIYSTFSFQNTTSRSLAGMNFYLQTR